MKGSIERNSKKPLTTRDIGYKKCRKEKLQGLNATKIFEKHTLVAFKKG